MHGSADFAAGPPWRRNLMQHLLQDRGCCNVV